MSFFVEPADGHDDYLMSAALAVEAAKDIETRPSHRARPPGGEVRNAKCEMRKES